VRVTFSLSCRLFLIGLLARRLSFNQRVIWYD
jgi:hypothetical protein